MSMVGCQMEGITVTESIGVIKKTLDAMIEEGELK
jgi:hypothetical protein